MDKLSRVLAGDPAAVDALASGDEASWTALVEHLFEAKPSAAPAALVNAMLAAEPELQAWLERAEDGLSNARSQWFTTVTSAMRHLRPWLFAGVRAVRPPDDPAVLWLRFDELQTRADEDALPLLRSLVGDLERSGAPASLLADALLLLAERAGEQGELDEALAAARRASQVDPGLARTAGRRIGALLLVGRQVEEALAVLEPAMERRELFGGGGAFSFGGDEGPRAPLDRALEEAATIAGWAARTTPEWVRALGGIAEHEGLPWTRFEEALEAMIGASRRPISDLEAVARQASERGLSRTALAAAEALAARFPESLDAAAVAGRYLAQAGQLERASRVYERAAEAAPEGDRDRGPAMLKAAELAQSHGDLARAEALLERARPWLAFEDPLRIDVLELAIALARKDDGALERGLELFSSVAGDPRALAESATGHALVETLVGALVARNDRRALDVQQRLVDAKQALWGECPALALERHNLATIHAELGDRDEARRGLEAALADLQRALGDGHPHVELAKRSLARLDAS